jgi:hypothetical protein
LALPSISAWKSFMCEAIMVSSFPEQAAYLYRLYYVLKWPHIAWEWDDDVGL